MPVYSINHTTVYLYSQAVALSHQFLHLEPLATDTQECLDFNLEVWPMPLETLKRTDYFGNRVHYLTVTEPHQELRITARSQVSVTPGVEPTASTTVEEARQWLAQATESPANSVRQFLFPSPAIPRLDFTDEWAKRIFPPQRPILDGVLELSGEINRTFIFDPGATHTETPLEELVSLQRGVCQDFAHLAVAVLRAAGLPGRYVSGYLLTNPPPGQPRRLGADASHAWASTYVPGHGWVDFDPTNDLLCRDEHITTAYGREFSDVSPVRGTVMGGGPQALFLGVTVRPAGEVGW
jgi:transglutaminase-like putative cysteine protease